MELFLKKKGEQEGKFHQEISRLTIHLDCVSGTRMAKSVEKRVSKWKLLFYIQMKLHTSKSRLNWRTGTSIKMLRVFCSFAVYFGINRQQRFTFDFLDLFNANYTIYDSFWFNISWSNLTKLFVSTIRSPIKTARLINFLFIFWFLHC